MASPEDELINIMMEYREHLNALLPLMSAYRHVPSPSRPAINYARGYRHRKVICLRHVDNTTDDAYDEWRGQRHAMASPGTAMASPH